MKSEPLAFSESTVIRPCAGVVMARKWGRKVSGVRPEGVRQQRSVGQAANRLQSLDANARCLPKAWMCPCRECPGRR